MDVHNCRGVSAAPARLRTRGGDERKGGMRPGRTPCSLYFPLK
jgi:hypothetical protein